MLLYIIAFGIVLFLVVLYNKEMGNSHLNQKNKENKIFHSQRIEESQSFINMKNQWQQIHVGIENLKTTIETFKKTIEDQKTTIEDQKTTIENLKKTIEDQKTTIEDQKTTIET